MATISLLSRLVNGVQRQVDLSSNILWVQDLQLNNSSGWTLAGTTSGHAGSSLIGDDSSYSNFTPSAATIKGALEGIDAALGASPGHFSDATFYIYDDGDPTKHILFEASGIATATSRTITMPDANVDLGKVLTAIQRDGSVAFTANQPMGGFKLTGLGAGSGAGDSVRYEQAILTSGANAFAADQSLGSHKLTNVSDPLSAQDAATKAYVDSLLDGRAWKQPVRVASTANIDLTVVADPSPVDGVTLADGDRILLKDQTAPEENGIYVAVTAVDPTTWVRSSDADTALELEDAAVFVEEGTVSHSFQYAQTSNNIVIGVTPLVWVVTSANSFSGHDMISLVGGQISVDLATVSGLESTNPGNAAGQLRIKLEASNPSLKFSGSNELGVKFDAAGALLSGASGVAVQVDNSTIEINSNALRVKDAGITLAKLASNSVDENKIVSTSFDAAGAITGGSGTKIKANVDNSSIEISANALRIKSTAYDQSTITGGSGSAAAVAQAPKQATTEVAGEAFAATTLFAVRWAKAADSGFVAGRVYKADYDSTSADNFHAIGLVFPAGSVSAAGNISVVESGLINVPTHGFTVGQPIFLTAAGAVSNTAPSASLQASVIVGYAKDANNIWVKVQIMGVN